jgi:CheY-like chemotaxis protein
VEDERIVARDLQQRLTSQGFCVPAIASSGEEALQKAAAVMPQLILMDVHLSGSMDGIEAARLIKEKLKIPVLFLTAYGDHETETKARLLNPVSYLGKPVDDQELYTALNSFFTRSRKSRK